MSCVGLTKVVANVDGRAGGGFTAHFTTEPFTKFVPVTVSVTLEELHDGVEPVDVAEEVTAVIVGPVMVKLIVHLVVTLVTHFGAPCVRIPNSAVPVA